MIYSKNRIIINNSAKSIRSLNIFSKFIKKNSNDISTEITNKPKVTGRGPFIELPSFKPLGNPSNLLNITLPQASKLNIRNGSIIAVNGDIKDLWSEVKRLTSKTSFQQLYSNAPISLVINGNSGNYSIIEIDDKDEEWIILNDKNIIAWTGFDFSLSPIHLFQKLNSFKSNGKGVIVVNGSNQLFGIDLQPNEEIVLNPNSLIASNKSIDVEILSNNSKWSKFPRISKIPKLNLFSILPTTGITGSFTNYLNNLRQTVSVQYHSAMRSIEASLKLNILNQYWKSFKSFIKLNLVNRLINNKPIYLKIKGPGKLLINNNKMISNYKIFTKIEVDNIFKNHRLK